MAQVAVGTSSGDASYFYFVTTNMSQVGSVYDIPSPGLYIQELWSHWNGYNQSGQGRNCVWNNGNGALVLYSGLYNVASKGGTNALDWHGTSDFNTSSRFLGAGFRFLVGYYAAGIQHICDCKPSGQGTAFYAPGSGLGSFISATPMNGVGMLGAYLRGLQVGGVAHADGDGALRKYALKRLDGDGVWRWYPLKRLDGDGIWRRYAQLRTPAPLALEPPPGPEVDFFTHRTIWYPGKRMDDLPRM